MKNSKLAKEASLATILAAFVALLTPKLGQSATLVTAEINLANVNDPAAVNACPQFACEPNVEFFGNNAGPVPTTTLINNTSYTITGITLTLPEDQDAQWEKGLSDIFSGINISKDARTISFTGGNIPVNQAAILVAESGNKTVNIVGSFSGEPARVPEPNSALGILSLATLGTVSVLKRKLIL